MAVSIKDLKEYLRLSPDYFKVNGEVSVDFDKFAETVKKSGVYVFIKEEDDWLLNGSVVDLDEFGIDPLEETSFSIEFETEEVSLYLEAAKSKALNAGVPEQENGQYDMFILALASMYYDNRGMTFQKSGTEDAAQKMINSFILELRKRNG